MNEAELELPKLTRVPSRCAPLIDRGPRHLSVVVYQGGVVVPGWRKSVLPKLEIMRLKIPAGIESQNVQSVVLERDHEAIIASYQAKSVVSFSFRPEFLLWQRDVPSASGVASALHSQ